MSRSRRHSPYIGLARSEQWYKRKGNRRLRTYVRRELRGGADDVWAPLDQFCDAWNGPKDGRIDIDLTRPDAWKSMGK